jgi:hypothetical protein
MRSSRIQNLHGQLLAQGAEGRFQLIEARTVPQIEQAVAYRLIAAVPTRRVSSF